MNTPLNRQLDTMLEVEEMRSLACELVLALVDEIRHHGDPSEASLRALENARKMLDLDSELYQGVGGTE